MKTIWKYDLRVTDEQYVIMPKGAEILCVQVQCGVPKLWALVTPGPKDAPQKSHRILTVGTGHPLIKPDAKYIGTYQIEGGTLVFHVFDAS